MNLAAWHERIKPRPIPHQASFRTANVVRINQRLRSALPLNGVTGVKRDRYSMPAALFPIDHFRSNEPVLSADNEQVGQPGVLDVGGLPGIAGPTVRDPVDGPRLSELSNPGAARRKPRSTRPSKSASAKAQQ